MSEAIQTDLSEKGVFLFSLNRPEVLNAMNKDLIMGLLETMNKINDDPNKTEKYYFVSATLLFFTKGMQSNQTISIMQICFG